MNFDDKSIGKDSIDNFFDKLENEQLEEIKEIITQLKNTRETSY